MNKFLLFSVFSILTFNVMAQEKIVQTAGVINSESLPLNLRNSMTMYFLVKFGAARINWVCVTVV